MIILFLSNCTNLGVYQLPSEEWYDDRNYYELSVMIPQWEKVYQEETKKKICNYPYSESYLQYIEIHLRNLYLHKSYIEMNYFNKFSR